MSELDLLVLGSGIAGLTAAVRAAEAGLRVGVITKGTIAQTATGWAQGGVAAVLGQIPADSIDQHLADTLNAGAGLCDEDAVRVLVNDGPIRVRELIALGAEFDRDPDGSLQLAREGGHSYARVVHAGGAATGAEIERALVESTARAAVAVHEHCFAADLIIEHGRCLGASVFDADGAPRNVRATHTLLATGGAGQLFAITTNPPEATGDGIAMALRADVAVADIEFVQFHPTALAVDRMPRPLLSEALRGHGALLRGAGGERFVDELQPRDIVARAILQQAKLDGRDFVWLDARSIENFGGRYPTLTAVLRDVGLDPARDLLPVAPAAHYLCGGVLTDLDGATELPGLWAAGEAACSGINGANRLASNSLLEGLVFGARVIESIVRGKEKADSTGAMRSMGGPTVDVTTRRPSALAGTRATTTAADRTDVQRCMTENVGVLRSRESLERALDLISMTASVDDRELTNLTTLALAVTSAALARTESRGAHSRVDFPDRDETQRRRVIVRG
ncbi:MAG: L-aspartate oxidase [Ilumatobacteraceae bacterium]